MESSPAMRAAVLRIAPPGAILDDRLDMYGNMFDIYIMYYIINHSNTCAYMNTQYL